MSATSERFDGYIGDRVPDQGGGAPVYVVRDGKREPLNPRHDIRNHSPDGFQWGYGGSGPAQLALAICCDAVGVARAQRVYQHFKAIVVASLPDAWDLERRDVVSMIEGIESDIQRERARE